MGAVNVFHLITGLDMGGAETMLTRLVLSMDKKRVRSTVLSMAGGGTYLAGKIRDGGVPVIPVVMRPAYKAPSGIAKLYKILRREKPDVLQTWLHHADFIGAITAAAAGDIPVVWNLRCAELGRGDHSGSLSWILPLLARLSRRPRAVVVNSTAGKLAHEALGYRPARWELIPNGFDVELFRPSEDAGPRLRKSLGLAPSQPVIGLVARYHPMKDHGVFIRAAGILHKRRPDVHFVMAGTGVDASNEQLSRLIEENGVAKNIHALGERNDIARLTAGFDIATCSSYSEGFPNVIGEAMACGVLCVATGAGDSAMIMGDTGVVVGKRDPRAMADAWEKIISMDGGERRALGMKARRRIESLYSMKRVTERYEALYEDIAGKNSSA